MKELFVRNVPFKATESDVFSAFQHLDKLVGVKIPTDRETGQPRGFAFVSFDDAESANAAMQEMNGSEMMGRALGVEIARGTGGRR